MDPPDVSLLLVAHGEVPDALNTLLCGAGQQLFHQVLLLCCMGNHKQTNKAFISAGVFYSFVFPPLHMRTGWWRTANSRQNNTFIAQTDCSCTARYLYSGHSKGFTISAHIHPFMHTFTHRRRRSQPRRATAQLVRSDQGEGVSLRGHLLHTRLGGGAGDRTSNLPVTSRPALPPEPHDDGPTLSGLRCVPSLPYSSSFLMAPSEIDRWEGSPSGNILILLIPLNRIVMVAVHTQEHTQSHTKEPLTQRYAGQWNHYLKDSNTGLNNH